jgi:predicted nuclease of predicted toxin-antitoxin system
MKIKLKLLLNENISYRVAQRLRQAGYDALSVYEIELTKTDDEIIFDYEPIHFAH